MAENTAEVVVATPAPAAAGAGAPTTAAAPAAAVSDSQAPAEVDSVSMDVIMKEYNDNLLRVDLQNQVAFYFSKQNLDKDEFLRSKMDENEFVPLGLVAGFPVIKRMFESRGWAGVDMKFLTTAVQGTNLRLSKDKKSVAAPSLLRTTIVIRDLPSTVQAAAVEAIFADSSCPAKPVKVANMHLWYIDFATEKDTSEVFAWLRSRKFEGKPIKGFIKSRHSGYIAAGPSAPPQIPLVTAPVVPGAGGYAGGFPGGAMHWQFHAPAPQAMHHHAGGGGHVRNGSNSHHHGGKDHHRGGGGGGSRQRTSRRDQHNGGGDFAGHQNRRGGAGQRQGGGSDRFSDRDSRGGKGGRNANASAGGSGGGAGSNGNAASKGKRGPASSRNEGDYGSGGGGGARSNQQKGGGGSASAAGGGSAAGAAARGQQQMAAKPPAMTQEEFPALPTKLPAEDMPAKPACTYSRLEVMRLMRDVVKTTTGSAAPESLVAVAPKLVEETPRKDLMPDVDPADIPEPSPIPPSPMVGAGPSPVFTAASVAMGAIPELGTVGGK